MFFDPSQKKLSEHHFYQKELHEPSFKQEELIEPKLLIE